MRNRIIVGAVAALAFFAVPARAQTANFDDLPADRSFPPSGYAGKDWNFLSVVSNSTGYGAQSSSGENFVYVWCCGSANSITQTGGGTFNFYSAFVSSLYGAADTFTAYGYDASNSVIFSRSVSVGGSGYTEIFDFTDVSKVSFSTDNIANLTLDDVSFDAAVTTPEPASLVLLGTGLLGMAGFARRRRQ